MNAGVNGVLFLSYASASRVTSRRAASMPTNCHVCRGPRRAGTSNGLPPTQDLSKVVHRCPATRGAISGPMTEHPSAAAAAAGADPAQVPRLLLLLAASEQLYAIDTQAVVEVIPQVILRPVTGAPAHQCGVFNFRGRVVPVVDVTQLIAGRPCAGHLSSRIVMVRHVTPDGETALLGLLAERVTDTLLKPLSDFQMAEGAAAQRPFLGGIALDERGLIQLLVGDQLASAALDGLTTSNLAGPETAPDVNVNGDGDGDGHT